MSLQPFYKFLSWLSFLIFICFIGIFNVFALTNNNSIYFYDNFGSSISSVSTSYIEQIDESSAIFTTTANSYGGAVIIQLSTPLIQNHIYSLFINVGAYSQGGYTELSTKNCIGLGTTFASASSSYVNCSISPRYTQKSGITTDKGRGLYYTFIANTTAPYLVVPYTTQFNCSNCQQYSFGYDITDGGDTTGLTASQVNSLVSQQTTIIQQDIASLQSSFSDVGQDIIDNQNANNEALIDSQKSCTTYDNGSIVQNGYLWTNGIIDGTGSTINGITDYININGATIQFLQNDNVGFYACYYKENKTLISCFKTNNVSLNTDLTIPSGAFYLRASISRASNKPQFKVCKNGSQAITDSVNDLNSSINDDDTGSANNDTASFITGFNTDTFGLTSIITAPLNLIQSLTSSSCTPLHLPLPYLNNKYLDLPCMTSIYQQHFGTFFTLYQTITYGIIAYWVCVRIFNHVKDFKNPEHDEIEVVDL